MTDKELIQALRGYSCQEWTIPNKAADRLEALLAENEHLREATKMVPRWVSVEERLPESEGLVLVTFTGKIQNKEYIGGYLLAEYVPGEGWILDEYPQLENPNVTHWCELPEPPSTEGVERMECKVYTYADHIRAMSDEELMGFLWQFNDHSFENVMPFCKNTVECGEELDSGDISTEMCKRCLLDKLQQPYESEGTPCST